VGPLPLTFWEFLCQFDWGVYTFHPMPPQVPHRSPGISCKNIKAFLNLGKGDMASSNLPSSGLRKPFFKNLLPFLLTFVQIFFLSLPSKKFARRKILSK
jgi:hypothetical protein